MRNKFISNSILLYKASTTFLKLGVCPFLAISRKTTQSSVIRLSCLVPSLFIYPFHFFLSLTSAFISLPVELIISIFISCIRFFKPRIFLSKFPFLFQDISCIPFSSAISIEPYVGQSVKDTIYFKKLFDLFAANSIDIPFRIFIVDTPFRLFSISSFIVGDNSIFLPCFGGFLEFLGNFYSQSLFLLIFTFHISRKQPYLLLTWFCLSLRVYSRFSFSLLALKKNLAYIDSSTDFKRGIFAVYDGILRDLVISSAFSKSNLIFYSHIPFFNSSICFVDNLSLLSRAGFIFEDPYAIPFLRNKLLITKCPFKKNILGSNIYVDHYELLNLNFVYDISVLHLFNTPHMLSCSSFISNFSCGDVLPILLLPQGFLSETKAMLSIVEGISFSNLSFNFHFKFYISIHPSLRSSLIVLNRVKDLHVSYTSEPEFLMHRRLIVLCGESSAFYEYSQFDILPLAFLSRKDFGDSVFSRLDIHNSQFISNSSDFLDFFSLLTSNI